MTTMPANFYTHLFFQGAYEAKGLLQRKSIGRKVFARMMKRQQQPQTTMDQDCDYDSLLLEDWYFRPHITGDLLMWQGFGQEFHDLVANNSPVTEPGYLRSRFDEYLACKAVNSDRMRKKNAVLYWFTADFIRGMPDLDKEQLALPLKQSNIKDLADPLRVYFSWREWSRRKPDRWSPPVEANAYRVYEKVQERFHANWLHAFYLAYNCIMAERASWHPWTRMETRRLRKQAVHFLLRLNETLVLVQPYQPYCSTE